MGRIPTWVLFMLAAVHVQVQALAFLAEGGTGETKPRVPGKLQAGMKDDNDPSLSLEDYKPVDPSPDSDTSKVKSSPIEHGERLNPYTVPKPRPPFDLPSHAPPSPAPSLTRTLKT